MSGERGSVLAQVLVLTLVAGLIAAAIIRARLQPALTAAQSVQRVSDDVAGQSALNRVSEVWARLGVCGSDSAAGVSCSGSGCSCSCTTPEATVSSRASGDACVLSTQPR